MLRHIATATLFLAANAVGLLAAAVLLPDFQITIIGFAVSLLFFSVVGIVLSPFITNLAKKYAPALEGGIALVTTFVGLLLTTLLTNGLSIHGFTTWVVAPLVVWIFVLLAGILLPKILFKKTLAAPKKTK